MPEFRYQRTDQPQVPAGPNPIYSGLAFAWFGSNPKYEVVTGSLVTTDNTTKVATAKGIGTLSAIGQVNTEWAKQFITTSNGAGTGDFTLVALANPSSGSTPQHIFAQKNDAGGSPFAQCALIANAGNNGLGSSGNFSFLTYNTVSSGVASAGGTAVDGNWHLWVAVRRGTSHELYRDGILIASSSLTVRSISQASRYTAIGSRGNGTTEGYSRNVSMAAGFNRALLPSEIATISANPWQLFTPVARSIWVPVAAGGDSTITQADGTSTASSLGGSATAATTPAAADGTSTAASIAASATAAAGVTQADGASTAATLVGVASTGSTITQADGSTVASVLAGSATSSAAATQADGVSTVGTLAGSATAASVLSSADGSSSTSTAAGSATSAAALTQADGLSTVSTLTGAGTGIAAFTQADGVSTTGTLTGTGLAAGSSTITPAAGSTTAGAIAGSSTAIAAITQADGTTTAGTLSSSSVSPAVMTAGAGTSTTSTLAGSSIFAAAMTQASGATTASAFAASAVAACVAIAAAGASSARALAGIPPNTSNLAGIIYEVPEDVRSSIVLADARGFTVLWRT